MITFFGIFFSSSRILFKLQLSYRYASFSRETQPSYYVYVKDLLRILFSYIINFPKYSFHQLFEIPLSNQKKSDETCRKIKVTQIIVFLQSSSAFFKITPRVGQY